MLLFGCLPKYWVPSEPKEMTTELSVKSLCGHTGLYIGIMEKNMQTTIFATALYARKLLFRILGLDFRVGGYDRVRVQYRGPGFCGSLFTFLWRQFALESCLHFCPYIQVNYLEPKNLLFRSLGFQGLEKLSFPKGCFEAAGLDGENPAPLGSPKAMYFLGLTGLVSRISSIDCRGLKVARKSLRLC